jgi:hypothetical protein
MRAAYTGLVPDLGESSAINIRPLFALSATHTHRHTDRIRGTPSGAQRERDTRRGIERERERETTSTRFGIEDLGDRV